MMLPPRPDFCMCGRHALVVSRNQVAGINHLAIYFSGQCGLGQACANRKGHLGNGDGSRVLALGIVGERDVEHVQ